MPWRLGSEDNVVNGPSWTIMTLAWVWLSYPAAASVLLRASDSGLPLLTLACLVAVFLPYTFLQPWCVCVRARMYVCMYVYVWVWVWVGVWVWV